MQKLSEIDALKLDGFSIAPEAEAELSALNDYWQDKTLVRKMGERHGAEETRAADGKSFGATSHSI